MNDHVHPVFRDILNAWIGCWHCKAELAPDWTECPVCGALSPAREAQVIAENERHQALAEERAAERDERQARKQP